MSETTPQGQQQEPRPLTATLLAISSGLHSAIYLYASFTTSDPFPACLAALTALLAWGLWGGKYTAWTLVVLASFLYMLMWPVVEVVLSGATLIIAFLPKTREYYRRSAGNRSQLSIRPGTTLKMLAVGLILLIPLGMVALYVMTKLIEGIFTPQ